MSSAITRNNTAEFVNTSGDTMTGPLLLPDGTQGAPSLARASATNTGVYFSAAGVLQTISGAARAVTTTNGVSLRSDGKYGFSSTADPTAALDTAVVRNAATIVEITNGSTGWGSLKAGRIVTGAATPTVAATGHGSTGSITVATGSSDAGGIITMTPGGAGIAASGTITLTYSTTNGAYGSNFTSVVVTLRHGSGTWNARASLILQGGSTTSVVINWDNNAVALTAGSTYNVAYHVIGL